MSLRLHRYSVESAETSDENLQSDTGTLSVRLFSMSPKRYSDTITANYVESR
jgi:hypothetical protein